jgi:putative drug exporter of the RND superfamily
MATWLYRLGRAAFRKAWLVFGAWIIALVAIGGIGMGLGGSTDEEFRIPGSESQEAFGRLGSVFPVFAGASVQVVIQTTTDEAIDSASNQAAIESLTEWLATVDGVEEAVSPFSEFASRAISDDGRVAFIQVQLTEASPQVSDETLDLIVSAADRPEASNFRVEFGGDVFQDTEVGLTIAEVIGLAFAGLVLVITFRSFRPAWMPLASAIIGVGIVLGVVFFAADYTTISSSAPLLAVMLGLAVGIDYSLFILSRHRNQLAADMDPEESAGVAVGTAGNAVVFAGGTVIVALLGLYLVNIPFLSVMGTAAAGAVAIAVVAAITLLPAFMGMMGAKLVPAVGSKARHIASLSAENPSFGRRWVRVITRFPLVTVIITVTGLAVLAIPAASLSLALPGGGQEPVDSTQRKAYDIISESFGPGYNGPLLLTVDITSSNALLDNLAELRDDLQDVPGVDFVSDGFPSPTLDTVIYQVVPTTAPDSEDTKDLVNLLRELAPEWNEEYEVTIQVTGITAIGIDISQRIQSALVPFGIVVVGLSIVLLLLVFRSIIVPIKAALGFILSVTGAFGVVVAVFQWGWFNSLLHVDTPGPILSFMPIILMAVLFGLAMDYQVFMVSGMREQFVHTKKAAQAIEEGYAQGARVVTAAAAIMFFVFFSFVPESSNLIKPIALGLAVGIALDAFVVRMTLVPAVMALFGKSAWWFPQSLEKSVPEADVEGEKLREHLVAAQWASEATSQGIIVSENLGIHGASSTPLSIAIDTGERITVSGNDTSLRNLLATLTGYLTPASGSLHVGGFALPSDAHSVRRLVSAWSRVDDDTLTPLGTSLARRMANSHHIEKLSASERSAQVNQMVVTIGSLCQSLRADGGRDRISASTLPGLLTRQQQIVAYAALALCDRSPIVIIGGVDPMSSAEERELWWAAIDALATTQQTVLLCTTPSLSNSSKRTITLTTSQMAGVN